MFSDLEGLLGEDAVHFEQVVCQGSLYDLPASQSGMKREEAKKDILSLFFQPSHWSSLIKQLFIENFPMFGKFLGQ